MDYRCDCCGKIVDPKDIGKGATHKRVEGEWETICKRCNQITK